MTTTFLTKLAIIGTTLGIGGCGTDPQRNPLGLTTPNQQKLNQTVGSLQIANRICTFYVSQTSTITTAYHCLEKDDSNEIANVDEITLELATGEQLFPDNYDLILPKQDLVTIKLVGKRKTYLPTSTWKSGLLKIVSYDQDSASVVVSPGCTKDQNIDVAGVFLHNCPTKGHSSGSPVLEDNKVVGIHLGYNKKLDRKIAYDFQYLQQKNTDILEIAIQKESCHSRAHYRGGVFGHKRAHVRGCEPKITNPVTEILNIFKPRKKQIADERREETLILQESIQAQRAFLHRIDQTVRQYEICIAAALQSKNQTQARTCISKYESSMNKISADIMTRAQNIDEALYQSKKGELQNKLNRYSTLSNKFLAIWTNYRSCWQQAVNQRTVHLKTKAIQSCRLTMKAGVQDIIQQAKVLL